MIQPAAMESLFLALIAFVCVALIIPFACPLARKIGFVDTPDARKRHDIPVPPIGGLIIIPVYMAVQIMHGGVAELTQNWALYAGLLALLTIGAWDDRWQLNAWVRFAVQMIVALVVVLFGACKIENLGNMFGWGDLWLGFMAIPFSIAAVALLINAINLMDGLDGLASGQSFIILAVLAMIAGLSGAYEPVAEVAPALGALAGFLIYNLRTPFRSRAIVFLGDAGTLCLGLLLAWHAIDFANNPAIELEPISMAWILALPIMDECAQFYRRVREGRHPFSADRGHFHHHFIDAGFSPRRAVAYILMFTAALALGGYGLAQGGAPLWALTILWITTILMHMHLTHLKGFYASALKKLR